MWERLSGERSRSKGRFGVGSMCVRGRSLRGMARVLSLITQLSVRQSRPCREASPVTRCMFLILELAVT